MPRGVYQHKKRPRQEPAYEPPPTTKRVTVTFAEEPVRLALRGTVEFVTTDKNPVEVLDDTGNVVRRLGTRRDGSYCSTDFYFDAPKGYAVRGAAGDKAVITYQLAASEENL